MTASVVGMMSLALMLLSHVADRRRLARLDPDRVGFMPWSFIFIMSALIALIAFSLAVKGG